MSLCIHTKDEERNLPASESLKKELCRSLMFMCNEAGSNGSYVRRKRVTRSGLAPYSYEDGRFTHSRFETFIHLMEKK